LLHNKYAYHSRQFLASHLSLLRGRLVVAADVLARRYELFDLEPSLGSELLDFEFPVVFDHVNDHTRGPSDLPGKLDSRHSHDFLCCRMMLLGQNTGKPCKAGTFSWSTASLPGWPAEVHSCQIEPASDALTSEFVHVQQHKLLRERSQSGLSSSFGVDSSRIQRTSTSSSNTGSRRLSPLADSHSMPLN
jgi:hypothetical protein